ncbi:hypothetical protein LTR49_025770 [Elasticomyces elasticus]|nr:hypothetical protein LTR49_025770 [Elasticomyces elasticus]
MAPNVLITGASGYLGGSLLEHLKHCHPLPAYGTIYALVRSKEQAKQVTALYNATPITLDLMNEEVITDQLLQKEISIVFYLIDAYKPDTQLRFINALEAVGKKTGITTHILHTSGAKLFSGFVGHPTDRIFSDADEGLFNMQKCGQSVFPAMKAAMDANTTIIETAEAQGVKSYIFIPCIVYGKGTGFGNQISIQTTAIIRAAKATHQVCKVDDIDGTWPVSSLHDTVTLYAEILRNILIGKDIGYGKSGYYMAASGSLAWADIYEAIGKALAKHDVVDSAEVRSVSDEMLEKAAKALGVPKDFVPVLMGGMCRLQADRGRKIDWTPKHAAEDLFEAVDAEVELILAHISEAK